jgi:heme exporter protein A
MNTLLDARALICTRDDSALFEAVSFRLCAGELLLIEGDNGVGKTTLLRALLGLAPLSYDALLFMGAPFPRALAAIRRQSRWLGHAAALKAELTIAENWRFWAALDDVKLDEAAVVRLAECVALAGFEDARVASLSAGQKKRAQMGCLLTQPSDVMQPTQQTHLWLLDEPFANLDRRGIALMEALMRDFLGGGGAILATSHGVLPFHYPHATLMLNRAISNE